MSIKLYQSVVKQIKDVINAEFGVVDENGSVIACSNESRIGEINKNACEIFQASEETIVHEGVTYKKISTKNKPDVAVFLEMDGDNSSTVLSLISINILNIKNFHEEKYDKSTFMKSIITENILHSEIPIKAKELNLVYKASRVVLLIKTEKPTDYAAYEIVQKLFPNRSKDFVVAFDEECTVLIKEVKCEDDYADIAKVSNNILDTLSTEIMAKAHIGVGTIVKNIGELANSYNDAQSAVLIGGIFESDKQVIYYNNLGIGRLIYQLPPTLCKLFLGEVFKEGALEELDQNTMLTINSFFDNSLNISETSRKMFVHRNSVIYRLDKVQKLTRLDIRMFDDAITFKVALMVKKYLDSIEKKTL